jgi:hypothetical protein
MKKENLLLADLVAKHKQISVNKSGRESSARMQRYKKEHQRLLSQYLSESKQKQQEVNAFVQKWNLQPVIDQLSELYSSQGLVVGSLESPGDIKEDFSKNFGYIPEIISEMDYLKRNGIWVAVRANKQYHATIGFDYRRILFRPVLFRGLQVEGHQTQVAVSNNNGVMDAVARIIAKNDDCFTIESEPYPPNDGGGY